VKVDLNVKNLIVIALVAAAGALGAVSRYLISNCWIHKWSERNLVMAAGFPFGTLCVNVLGSFVVGVVIQVHKSTGLIPEPWHTAIAIGFLGALTTFSTFSYETLYHAEAGRWSLMFANIAANVVLCIISVWGGMTLIRAFVGSN